MLSLGSIIAVRSAVTLAKTFHRIDFFTGLVILLIGSELPELVITITASLDSVSGTYIRHNHRIKRWQCFYTNGISAWNHWSNYLYSCLKKRHIFG